MLHIDKRVMVERRYCSCAKDNGVQVIFDEIAIDNPSISLFMKCGFQEVLRTNESVLVKKDL